MSKFNLLVVGAGRGGTTLLAGLLNAHSEITMRSEYKSRACLMDKEVQDAKKLVQERSRQFVDECSSCAKKTESRIWGNKITTEQLRGLEEGQNSTSEVLDIFFNKFLNQQKVIFILRDGRTCIRSKMKREGLSLQQASANWIYSTQICDFLSTRRNALIIKYEDLVLTPEDTLKKVCSFLNLEYEETMKEGTSSPIMKYYKDSTIDISKITLDGIHPDSEELLSEYLKKYDYL